MHRHFALSYFAIHTLMAFCCCASPRLLAASTAGGLRALAAPSGRIDHAANTGCCQHARSTQSNLWPAGLLEADGGGHPQAVRVNEALVRSSEEQLLLGDQSRAQAGVEIGVLTAKCAHGGERVERWQGQGRCEEGLALGEGLAALGEGARGAWRRG